MEDEEEENGEITKPNVLIDPDKEFPEGETTPSAGGEVNANNANQGNPNDPNNLQQQQQIYYNNYAGQAPQPQPQQQLIDPNKHKQQPQQQLVPQQTMQEKKAEPVDPVPELF